MATVTISLSDEFESIKLRFPDVDWNEVLKRGILRRLEALKRFEGSKVGGVL